MGRCFEGNISELEGNVLEALTFVLRVMPTERRATRW
jgi:hypothetical protein